MRIEDIKFNYRIEEVIGRSVHLKKQGPEMVGNCPFHNDEHASMKVNPVKQIFKCFACDVSGDMLDFFTKQGHTMQEAKDIITNGQTINIPLQPRTPEPPAVIWKNVVPNQETLPDPLKVFFKPHESYPDNYWTYHNNAGQVIGYVCRFNLPEGKKDVIPYTYNTDGQKYAWKWRGFDLPRSLYNLHEIYLRPKAIILVVEGEKACDAAKILFPQYVCVTWCGGKDNVKSADWSPLEGRNVFLWGDNDTAGVLAMFGGWEYNEKSQAYKRFKGVCEYVAANFKRIQNSPSFPKKWDVADAIWTPEEATEYLKNNRTDIPAVSEFPPNEQPVPAAPELPPPPPPVHVTSAPSPPIPVPAFPEMTEDEDDAQVKNPYFKCLGFENSETNLYVFFVYRTNTIIKLSAGGINTSNLLQLAPLSHWEGNYPKSSRSGSVKFEINTVANHLITVCIKQGIFNSTKIRGRGAWIDNGVPVIHCGDHLIVNGIRTDFSKHRSRYIYEAGQELGFELTQQLSPTEANKLIQLLERLPWGRDINARLLAGWIVIAPLCGALSWRSHLWLTGSAGSGKSEIMKLFIKRFMGQMFVNAQGATTEAGIRQYLKADALPVVFDEAESENTRGADRMQAVLEIMRASSTSDGGKIIKGSSGGSAAEFNIRSCFAFASIGANLTQRSDASRITVLEIKPDMRPDKKERWQETLDLYYGIVTEDYITAFQSRSVMLMPIILANAKTFSNAAAAELDNQRTGDQLGALLAGAYSLYSDSLISYEDAKKWIKERDWAEERLAESTRDENKILHKIMDTEIRVETSMGDRNRTVGELIIAARGDNRDKLEEGLITQERANQVLRRIGILIEGSFALFSDQSQFIAKVLYNTPYSKNYHTILARVNNAVKVDNVMFGSHVRARATKIDTSEIFGAYAVEPVALPIENHVVYKQEEINFKNN